MLAVLTAPLAWGLFLYHVYLIWAGMTTNESHKWADWRDDIADGIVFKGRRRSRDSGGRSTNPGTEPKVAWPLESDQILVRREQGWPPSSEADEHRTGPSSALDIDHKDDGKGWTNVMKLEEVYNIYDLGFWDNLGDILRIR